MASSPPIPPPLHFGETPQAALRACHEQTRRYLHAAERLLTADSTTGAAEIVDLCSGLRIYFAEVLPIHELDERLTVIPALPRDAALEEDLKMIANEHALLEIIVGEIDQLWSRLCDDARALDGMRPELAAATRRLVAVFELHHAREETQIFPRVASLPEETQALLLAEMRQRRSAARPS